ncbi:MAG: sensor domain-containing phosphodiesterase [Mycobacteriaceae bacterium]
MALAAGRFAFLMALVNALDAGSRHTIAAVGAPLGTVARPGTLCDEVVRSGVPVVRRDITVLPLAAPGIRAYVGVPLTGREGPVIGTLCLSNIRPRTFSAEQMVQLVAIGAVVQDQLELVRRRGPWPAGSVADATELAAAIESRQVVPYYQPVVDLRTGRVDAVEALARWRHPVRGMLAPAEFIPLAEDTDIILDLDLAVLRQAVADFARWRPHHPWLALNVNLSARHFDYSDCVERITGAITGMGMSPSAVNLEVTETAAMAVNPSDRNFLADLREQGFRILLDDFGTGFSTMEHVLRLPIDGHKLGSTVTAALGTLVGDVLVRAFVSLAADLNLSTVIEGIATPEQAARAPELGGAHAQGYLWAGPLPATDVTGLLSTQHAADPPGHGSLLTSETR